MNIVFHAGYYSEPWNLYHNAPGIGGTEQCIMGLSQQLAMIGHDVFVVGNLKPLHDKYPNSGNLRYLTIEQISELPDIDILIGVSYLHYQKYYNLSPNTKKIFWLHNEHPHIWYRGNEMSDIEVQEAYLGTDIIVCLTDWHKEYFLNNEPFAQLLGDRVEVIGNGIHTSLVEPVRVKIKDSYVYTSHPERGLDAVISDFEKKYIKGHLHISTPSYGLDFFAKYYSDRISKLENVTYHGSLPTEDLYKLLSRMEYWYYPTHYNETYCITALEMLAHHVKPMVNELAGLKETLGGFTKETQDWNKVDEYVSTRDWKNVSKEWINIMESKSDYIEMTYVITLDSVEKKEELTKRVKDSGIDSPVYIFPASNGHTGENMTDNYTVADWWKIDSENRFWNRNVLPGEIGCSLSHWRVWKDAYDNGYERILILEEDFKSTRKFDIEEVKTDHDWTLMYLGHNFMSPPKSEINKHLVVPSYTYNSHAYMLTREGCKLFMEQQFNQYIFPLDEFLSTTHSVHPRKDLDFITKDTRAVAVVPYMFGQTSSKETSTTEMITKQRLRDIPYPEFCDRFVTYSARLKEYDLIVDEPIRDIFTFPLFTKEFCNLVIEEAQFSDKWTKKRHDNYPTTDMLIQVLGLQKYYQKILEEFVYPVAIHKWKLEGKMWGDMISENFIIKYEEDVQGHLSLHHDGAVISMVLALNDDYEGGGTWFSRQQQLHKGEAGHISVHPSVITHRHGARPVTKGKRFVLVSFCNKR